MRSRRKRTAAGERGLAAPMVQDWRSSTVDDDDIRLARLVGDGEGRRPGGGVDGDCRGTLHLDRRRSVPPVNSHGQGFPPWFESPGAPVEVNADPVAADGAAHRLPE